MYEVAFWIVGLIVTAFITISKCGTEDMYVSKKELEKINKKRG